MALRGSMTAIDIFTSFEPPYTPLASYQNHFHPSFYDPNADTTYTYKSFTRSDITSDGTSTNSELRLDFFATTENIALVEDAINNGYFFIVFSTIWDSTESIDAPTSVTVTSAFTGVAVKADITHTTASLTLGSREDALNGDFPFKKIPYAILGPLNLGN